MKHIVRNGELWRHDESRRNKVFYRPRILRLGSILVLGLAAWATTGCSLQRLHEVDQFAGLGAAYTQAVDQALIQTGQLAVTSSSQRLLDDRALSPVSRDELEARDLELRNTARELGLLREQMVVLGDYFRTLAALSTSQAPGQIAAGLDQSATSMASLSSTAGAGHKVGRVTDVGAGVGSLWVRRHRMKILEAELDTRRDLVAEVLELHRQLLGDLKGIADQQGFVGRRQYVDNVVRPFIDEQPLPCPEAWAHARQTAVLAGSLSAHIDLMITANQELTDVWTRLVNEELESLDLAQLRQVVDQAAGGPLGIPALAQPASWSCFPDVPSADEP